MTGRNHLFLSTVFMKFQFLVFQAHVFRYSNLPLSIDPDTPYQTICLAECSNKLRKLKFVQKL